jgi:hypothetical protein
VWKKSRQIFLFSAPMDVDSESLDENFRELEAKQSTVKQSTAAEEWRGEIELSRDSYRAREEWRKNRTSNAL